MTIDDIIAELKSIASKEYTSYSPYDRQRAIQLQLEFLTKSKEYRKTATNKDRERKLHRARQMRLLEGTVKDRESMIEESEEYQSLVIEMDIAVVERDHCKDTLPVFNSLVTLIRDAEKLIGEEIK